MVIFMPHIFGAGLDEVYDMVTEHESFEALKKHIVETGKIGRDKEILSFDDIVITQDAFGDERIGWNNEFTVCTKRYGDMNFDIPQCIGYCSTDYDKNKMWRRCMIRNSDDGFDCYVTQDEWKNFCDDYDGITPCQEYGMCSECPYGKESEK